MHRPKTLEELQTHLDKTWVFDQHTYPEMPDPALHPNAALRYAYEHIVLHLAKDVGLLAAAAERAHHDPDILMTHNDANRERVQKMFRSIIRLATILGVSPEELLQIEAVG